MSAEIRRQVCVLPGPLFTKINEPFVCIYCHFSVPKSQQTCRDHCPQCLHSLHVDVNPGDRAADCGGLLKPVAWSRHKKKGLMIHYICEICSTKKVNKFLEHDVYKPDDLNVLLKLSSMT
jgi:hypothetical protein